MIKKLSIALAILLSITAVTCVVVFVIVHNSNKNLITNNETIIVNEEEYTEFKVSLSDIAPGVEQVYFLPMTVTEGGNYQVTFAFENTGEEDSLSKYLDTEIRLNDEKVDGAKLSELLAGKQVVMPLELEKGAEVEVEIVYVMGLDVGDEAQNTKASFKLTLTVER